MDRNPSPPLPSRDQDEEEGAGGDCIGSTVYSKHWLFGVLSGLIQVWKVAPRVDSRTLPQPPGHASGSPLQVPLPDDPSRGMALSVLAASTDPRTAESHFPVPLNTKGGRVAGMLECLRLKYCTSAYSPRSVSPCKYIARLFAPHSHCRF